jgi:hypothetical protein
VNRDSFLAGLLHGVLGGLLGLGGAALRIPHLAGQRAPETALLSNGCALVVVVAAWLCRAKVIPLEVLATNLSLVASLLAGALAGGWWAAGAMRSPWLTLAILPLALLGAPGLAGVGIGVVMGYNMAGGLLLVPAIVLLSGLDVAVAGSLALMVSAPLLLAGLLRERAAMLAMLRREPRQCAFLAGGAVAGAGLGTLLLGLTSGGLVMTLLEALLVYAALLNFVIFPNFYTALMDRGGFFTKFFRSKR